MTDSHHIQQSKSNSQGAGVSGRTEALAGLMVADGAVEALALQQAVLAVEVGVAGLLAAPALEAVGADAGSCYRVTFGPVPALTAVTAVGPPEVTLTTCRGRGGGRGGCESTCDLKPCDHPYLQSGEV